MRSMRPLRSAHKHRRNTIATASVAAGVALGLAVAAGVTAASASAYDGSAAGASLGAATSNRPWIAGQQFVEPIGRIAADARTTLAAAHQAVAAAAEVSSNVAASGLDVGSVTSVDTTVLSTQIDRLTPLDTLPLFFVPAMTDKTAQDTQKVVEATASLRSHFDAAMAKRAGEIAAAKAKAEAAAKAKAAAIAKAKAAAAAKAKAAAAAKAKAAAARPRSAGQGSAGVVYAASNSVAAAQAAARQIAASQYGWGAGQFSCLVQLWNRESGWNYRAYNAGSGATGIPQALPGSKMGSIAPDWRTNAVTQIRWGLRYIAGSYGSPCAAWGHSQATGWY